MDSRSLVALILTVGVVLTILSGTSLRFLWTPVNAPPMDMQMVSLWKDLVLVILGMLAGYISGRDK
jgi:hypothetical protein